MKTEAVIRKIDDLGRVVIPKALRSLLEWREGTPLEIYREGNKVILEKFTPTEDISTEIDWGALGKFLRRAIPAEISFIVYDNNFNPKCVYNPTENTQFKAIQGKNGNTIANFGWSKADYNTDTVCQIIKQWIEGLE